MKPFFIHLHTHSCFSFLDGASSIKALVESAAALDMPALALTDHNNVSGAVLFQQASEKYGIRPIQGVELTLKGGSHLVLLCNGPKGYANLCRLITSAHMTGGRFCPELDPGELKSHSAHLFALSGCRKSEIARLIFQRNFDKALDLCSWYKDVFGDRFFLEMEAGPLPGTHLLNSRLKELSDKAKVPLVVSCNVHYARREDFKIHDILTCVRTLTQIWDVHPERRLNPENYMKTASEVAVLKEYPEVMQGMEQIVYSCEPALDLKARHFPSFDVPSGLTSHTYLSTLVFQGAAKRYGKITERVRARLLQELDIISRLGYADYFLLVWDVARFARENGIRYAGRGSAADSAVAYCLEITEVDAIERGLLFERFLSLERAQKPDIDIDFDQRYRDRVADYVYKKYGKDHVATVCTFNTYRARSAVRDLGKVLGYPAEEIDRIAKRMPWIPADSIEQAIHHFPELRDAPVNWGKYSSLFEYCAKVAGFPRHLGTHLGGLVISKEPVLNHTPLQLAAKGVAVSQFDKDAIEDLGLVKLDLLSLRTLSAVDIAVSSIREERPDFDYDAIPSGDPDTYRMLNTGETIGVFQLESPAQRALQSRLGADCIEDIVASVALIRPGPIKGNMVEPFLRRRHGEEEVSYLHPRLRPILEKTYGVVLFQEQVIEIATAIAGFTPGEADRLRRVMTHSRSQAEMDEIGQEFVKKAVTNGIEEKVAHTIFSYIAGYASYGFCEAHAAAFAKTAYKTAYLIRHYPAQFFAAILSMQPMGYYSPQVICQEAAKRGIRILGPDINLSQSVFLPENNTIRVSLKQVQGMTGALLSRILKEREHGAFTSFEDFCSRVRPDTDILQNLILCGAFDGISDNRKLLLWKVKTGLYLKDPLLQPNYDIKDFSLREKICHEYNILGIMVSCHIMDIFRKWLCRRGFLTVGQVKKAKPGSFVKIAGLPIRPHRPPVRSSKTIVFMAVADETGMVDVTVFEPVYLKYGSVLFRESPPPLVVSGRTERRGNQVTINASSLAPFLVQNT